MFSEYLKKFPGISAIIVLLIALFMAGLGATLTYIGKLDREISALNTEISQIGTESSKLKELINTVSYNHRLGNLRGSFRDFKKPKKYKNNILLNPGVSVLSETVRATGLRLTNKGAIPIKIKNFSINESLFPLNSAKMAENLTDGLVSQEEKALALFDFISTTYSWDYVDVPLNEPTDLLHVIGSKNYGLCTVQAKILCQLASEVGLNSRLIEFQSPGYHVATEIFIDGEYRFFDPTAGYFVKDGAILSLEALSADENVLDDVAMSLDKNLAKLQLKAEENHRRYDCDQVELQTNLAISLLPNMSFEFDLLEDIPVWPGYLDKDSLNTYYGLFANDGRPSLGGAVTFETGLTYAWAKFRTEKDGLSFSINGNEQVYQEAVNGEVTIIPSLFKESPLHNPAIIVEAINQITIFDSENISDYQLIVELNPNFMPVINFGLNNITYEVDHADIPIELSY